MDKITENLTFSNSKMLLTFLLFIFSISQEDQVFRSTTALSSLLDEMQVLYTRLREIQYQLETSSTDATSESIKYVSRDAETEESISISTTNQISYSKIIFNIQPLYTHQSPKLT